MNQNLSKLLEQGVNAMFPEYKCIFCGSECEDVDMVICNRCKEEVVPLNENMVCEKCGRPLTKNYEHLCRDCAELAHPFDKARAVYIYEEGVAHCVTALKYNGEKYRAKIMAKHMARLFVALGWKVDAVTYVPMSEDREKERGYNQAKLICEEFAKLTGLTMMTLLVQPNAIDSQVGLSKMQRLENLSGAFKVVNKSDIKGKRVLILDDVYTTGATLHCCANVLLHAGAKAVFGLTFAKGILD